MNDISINRNGEIVTRSTCLSCRDYRCRFAGEDSEACEKYTQKLRQHKEIAIKHYADIDDGQTRG